MRRLSYIGAVTGETVELDGPKVYSGTALDLRANSWDYSLVHCGVESAVRAAHEPNLAVWAKSLDDVDRMIRVFDADMAAKRPGTFLSGGWSQRGLVAACSPSSLSRNHFEADLTVLLLDGVWRRPEIVSMFPSSGDGRGTKVYPYTYAYRYAADEGVRFVSVSDAAEVPFGMTIYGYAVNPSISIAGNIHQFNITVPAGGYLLVDARPDPSVTLVTAEGLRTEAFSSAVRGDGEGCGRYAFQRLPPGTSEVRWPDSFGFDLTIYHESGTLPFAE